MKVRLYAGDMHLNRNYEKKCVEIQQEGHEALNRSTECTKNDLDL